MKHISIIIIAHNAQKYISEDYWDTFLENSDVKGFKKSLIIFDNASSSKIRSVIKKKYPQVDLIYSFKNEGYGKAVNYALQYAYHKYESDYFVISDQDVRVGKDYLKNLINFMEEKKDAGFVQPLCLQLLDASRIYSAGHSYTHNGRCFTIKKIDNTKDFKLIPSGSILCSIIRKEVLTKVGLLDERFEIYYESSDWGFRIRKAGYKIYCLYSSIVFHEREQQDSTPYQMYFVFRNCLLFWAKHNRKIFNKCLKLYRSRLRRIKKGIESKPYIQDPYLLSEYIALGDALNYSFMVKRLNEPRVNTFNKESHLVCSLNKKYF